MSTTVTLSDEIVYEAHRSGELTRRTVADQIEYWAHLGRLLERLLRGDGAQGLRVGDADRTLSECAETIDTDEGRQRVFAHLDSRPSPHYEPAPDGRGLLVRVEKDGTRTLGRFVGRAFQAKQLMDFSLFDRHRLVATFDHGQRSHTQEPLPDWLPPLLQ